SASAFASTSSLLSNTSAYCSTSRSPHVRDETLWSSASLDRSVLSENPSDLYGAKYFTCSNGVAGTRHFSYRARSGSSRVPGWSRKQRSGPFTLKQTAATDPFFSGKCAKIDERIHSIALVFVARPETPVMFKCAASGPIRKSAST